VVPALACAGVTSAGDRAGSDRGRVAVVVGGGGAPAVSTADLGDLGTDPLVVAADSGLQSARALGLRVDAVVGDMDSVDPEQLDAAARAGVIIERHPVAKDATDLDLAIDRVLGAAPGRLVVVTGTGDRFDHALGVVTNLAAPGRPAIPIEAFVGPAHVWVVRDEARLVGTPGDVVSLVPVHGSARGISTTGLAFPLDDEDLAAGTTRGLSNRWVAPVATVRVRAGVVLAIAPGAGGER
jgi:thiamine pyrophosphokinase